MLGELKTEPEIISKEEVSDKNSVLKSETKPWKNKVGSKQYLIYINDQTKFYEKTKKDALEKMEEIADYIQTSHPDYTFTFKKTDNGINIMKCNKWFIINYDELFCSIWYKPIHILQFNKEEEEEEDEEEKNE